MANRPILPYLWASESRPTDIGDADVFVPSNPVYPEQQPNQYTVGWSVPDATVVKQPHHWMNSWYQSVDYVFTMQRSGELGWDSAVHFRQGATCLHGGKRYTAQVSNLSKRPDINPTIWFEARFGLSSAAEVQATLSQINSTIDLHVKNYSNPHATSWNGFFGGIGSSKSQIDSQVTAEANSINTHKADKGNPHNLTCAQVNVLPVTGGTFTGQVGMLRALWAGAESIRRNGALFELANNGNSMGIDKVAWKDGEEMLTESNFHNVRMRNSIKFSVPTPAIHLALVCDVNAYTASGPGIEYLSTGTIEYTNKSGVVSTAAVSEPAFGVHGLELRTGKGQKINVVGAYQGTNGTVFGILDGVPILADVTLDKTNLLDYFPLGTAIKDIRLWNQPLTAYQKAALGVTT